MFARAQLPAEVHVLIITTAPPINAYILPGVIFARTEAMIRRAYPTLIAVQAIVTPQAVLTSALVQLPSGVHAQTVIILTVRLMIA